MIVPGWPWESGVAFLTWYPLSLSPRWCDNFLTFRYSEHNWHLCCFNILWCTTDSPLTYILAFSFRGTRSLKLLSYLRCIAFNVKTVHIIINIFSLNLSGKQCRKFFESSLTLLSVLFGISNFLHYSATLHHP